MATSKDCIGLPPSRDRLMVKYRDLYNTVKAANQVNMQGWQQHFLSACNDNLNSAKEMLRKRILRSNVTWRYLHHVDEDLLVILPPEQLSSRATDIKCAMELNIKQSSVRAAWIGENGKLNQAIRHLQEKKGNEPGQETRHALRQALKTVNEQIDRGFWTLSMNTRIAVASGLLLGIALVIYIFPQLFGIDWFSSLSSTLSLIAVLGCAGAYLGNLLTKSNFLFVPGGPFWVFLIYHLLVRPILGSFAAVFIYILEKTKLLFSLGSISDETVSLVLSENSSDAKSTYMYAVLAIVSGFAAEKLLRSMMDRFLSKLEQKAEKTKETQTEVQTG